MQSHNVDHDNATIWVLRYLRVNSGQGIFLSADPSFDLLDFCDADWASFKDKRYLSGFYHSWRCSYFMEIKKEDIDISIFCRSRVQIYVLSDNCNYLVGETLGWFVLTANIADSYSFWQSGRSSHCKKFGLSWTNETCGVGLTLCSWTVSLKLYHSFFYLIEAATCRSIYLAFIRKFSLWYLEQVGVLSLPAYLRGDVEKLKLLSNVHVGIVERSKKIEEERTVKNKSVNHLQ